MPLMLTPGICLAKNFFLNVWYVRKEFLSSRESVTLNKMSENELVVTFVLSL